MIRVLEVFGEPLSNGGQESFIMNMYRNIDRTNMQFDFYTPYYCDNKNLINEIENLGGKVYYSNGRFNSVGNKKDFVINLNNFLKKHKYEIVHIHSGSTFSLFMGSIIAKHNNVKKVIIHSHCGGIKNLKYRIVKFISTPFMLKYTDYFYACSHLAAQWKFPNKIINNKKYIIMKNAIDTNKIYYNEKLRQSERKKLNIKDNTLVFGHIGRFSYQKNHEFLIDIFNNIHKKNNNTLLLLIGTGEELDNIKNKVNELNLNDSVKFLGIRKDINELLNIMDAFILPSRFEGLPVVGVEAQSTGLMVFTSNQVTKELPLNDLVKYYDLDDPLLWSNRILKELKTFKRINTTKRIIDSGYDVKEASNVFQNKYLSILNKDIKMYVITHKEFKCPSIQCYTPLLVGNQNVKEYLHDNTFDNISSKNKYYCELTGIYWLYKNIHDIKYIGISHYRRYFTKQKILRNKFIKPEDIKEILNKYDIILPKKEIYRETAYEQYCIESGFSKDLDKIENIIKKKYPEYLKTYKKIMNQNHMHQYNMMICNKELFDNYSKWLFDILFELEKTINYEEYNDYQKRIYGFLSERLLNVWVYHNNLKVKELRVVNLSMNIKDIIKINLMRIKNEVIYKLRGRNEKEL